MSNTLDTPFLSIIIPVFNEEYRLPSSLVKIHDFLIKQSYSFEVIVVENGSSDHTVDVVLESQKNLPYMRLIQTPKRGKGLAVKLGMLAARGQYRFLADADLSMPIQEIIKFLPPQLEKVEVVIGSRELPLSKRFDEPVYRHLIGRGFNTLVRWLTLPG
ncbi:MAG: glycosyltransferase, partial [Anaerolineaceae bacterium]|nr:glycosyltransferase [Anaerolineaceae bacterium]